MRSTSHRGAQGVPPGTDFPLLHSQSYLTEPPDLVTAATASRRIVRLADKPSQPNANHEHSND